MSLPAHFRYNLTNRSKFMRSKRATYGCVVSLIYIMDETIRYIIYYEWDTRHETESKCADRALLLLSVSLPHIIMMMMVMMMTTLDTTSCGFFCFSSVWFPKLLDVPTSRTCSVLFRVVSERENPKASRRYLTKAKQTTICSPQQQKKKKYLKSFVV